MNADQLLKGIPGEFEALMRQGEVTADGLKDFIEKIGAAYAPTISRTDRAQIRYRLFRTLDLSVELGIIGPNLKERYCELLDRHLSNSAPTAEINIQGIFEIISAYLRVQNQTTDLSDTFVILGSSTSILDVVRISQGFLKFMQSPAVIYGIKNRIVESYNRAENINTAAYTDAMDCLNILVEIGYLEPVEKTAWIEILSRKLSPAETFMLLTSHKETKETSTSFFGKDD